MIAGYGLGLDNGRLFVRAIKVVQTRPRIADEDLRLAARVNLDVHMNYPIPIGNCFGYSEGPWLSWYRSDWRALAGRVAFVAAFNVPGGWNYMCGHIVQNGHPASEEGRYMLRSMLMYDLGLSLLDFKQMQQKRRMLTYGAPYLQAVCELHGRKIVPAVVKPDFWAMDGNVEAYAWKGPGYGLLTVSRHSRESRDDKVVFLGGPMGLAPGKAVFVWRLMITDPKHADYSLVKVGQPLPRFARQELVTVESKASGKSTVDLKRDTDFPELILLTHCPGVISKVGNRQCQLWLPRAYGSKVSGSLSGGGDSIDLMVESPRNSVEVMVAIPQAWPDHMVVMLRNWGKTTVPGVAVGYEPGTYELVRQGGFKLAKLAVPSGQVEVKIRPR